MADGSDWAGHTPDSIQNDKNAIHNQDSLSPNAEVSLNEPEDCNSNQVGKSLHNIELGRCGCAIAHDSILSDTVNLVGGSKAIGN